MDCPCRFRIMKGLKYLVADLILGVLLFWSTRCHAENAKFYVNAVLSNSSPYYATNLNQVLNPAPPGLHGDFLTNAVAGNSTNYKFWTNHADLIGWEIVNLQLTWSNGPGTNTSTNNFALYPCNDNVNDATNFPIWSSGPIPDSGSGSNLLITNPFTTNASMTRWYMLGWNRTGTNYCTNAQGQVFASKLIRLTTGP